MLQVRSSKMNTKLIKMIAAGVCATTALGFTLMAPPAVSEAAKKAPIVAKDSKALLITIPEHSDEYGIGIYRIEGILEKNTKIKISLDDEAAKDLTTNSQDGQYDLDVEVKNAGKHTLLLAYTDSKGKEVTQKLEFNASDKTMGLQHSDEPEANNEEAPIVASTNHEETNVEPEPDSNNEEPTHESTLLPDTAESSGDPNSAANRKAGGIHDEAIKPKVEPVKPKATKIRKGIFVLSSHSNFNVVPRGIIKIGGRGNPGDRIMLLVDNKPSMKGTIKPDGKWSFPVKISNPGSRRITAQDLKSREAKTVKLKIK